MSNVSKSKPLPKLPVASALWKPMPDFETGAAAWILAGGTHHSCFAYGVTPEYWEDYAEMAGIEMLHIDKATQPSRSSSVRCAAMGSLPMLNK